MIGQEKLIQQFNNFSIDTLPHSIILLGKYGSGKHLFSSLIAQQFNLKLNNIEDKINLELLEQINQEIEPVLCVIEGTKLTVKEQAVLLKFIEEPLSNIFIMIIGESTANILDTIINRCQIYRMAEYNVELLKTFCPENILQDNLLFTIADTPGKLLNWNLVDIPKIYALCIDILGRLKMSGLATILTIIKRLKFNADSEGFDINLFAAILHYCTYQQYLNDIVNRRLNYKIYNLTNTFTNNLLIPNINTQYLLEHYLFELKGLYNEGI